MLGCSSTANPPQVFPRVSRNEWHLISTPTVWKIVTPIHTSAFLIYTRAPWVELLNEMSVWMYLPFPEVFLSPNFLESMKIRIYRAQADRVQRQWVKKTKKKHICLIKCNLSSLTDLLSACLQSEARWSVHLFILFWIYCPRKIISWCKYRDSANDSEIYTNESINIKMKALFEDITVTYFPHPHPQRVVDCL